jgi:ADP-ribose pyrophosphatase
MSDSDLPKWKTNSSRYIVNDRWLKLRADSCTTPDGHILDPWYVIEYPGWVNCLVIDKNNNVILLEHYRHGIDEYVPEIIAGNMDESDNTPSETIKRELKEEIGYTGGRIFQTGVCYANPSSQNNLLYCYLAVGGECSDDVYNEIGADFKIEPIPFEEFIVLISANNKTPKYQSLHLASIYFSFNFIKNNSNEYMQLSELKKILGS